MGCYAAYLLLKLKKQTAAYRQANQDRITLANERRESVITDIRYIAVAMLEERCELSEGVMRIGKLFDALSLTEQVTSDYPSLFTHYQLIQSHPIKEERKALPKQQRMKLDFARMKSEAELETTILQEVKQITTFEVPVKH
nr:DUF2489 domain-containing protein [Shewanella intestini]